MSWDCPRCERKYPDSSIGLPKSADAYEKTHCRICEGGLENVNRLIESAFTTNE